MRLAGRMLLPIAEKCQFSPVLKKGGYRIMNIEHLDPELVVDKRAVVGEGSLWDADRRAIVKSGVWPLDHAAT